MNIKNIKSHFNKMDKKTKIMLNIYIFASFLIMISSYFFNYILKESEISFLLVELSLLILSIGIWGSVFCEVYKKRRGI